MAGNSDGSIPPWQKATVVPLPGWTTGKDRGEFSPFHNEAPTKRIDHANSQAHKTFLTSGQLALLTSKPGYTMPLYPTHRSCGFPDFVLKNTQRFHGEARIAMNGWQTENATLPSIPFPQPRSGIEALWNFLLAYQGVGMQWTMGMTYLSSYSLWQRLGALFSCRKFHVDLHGRLPCKTHSERLFKSAGNPLRNLLRTQKSDAAALIQPPGVRILVASIELRIWGR